LQFNYNILNVIYQSHCAVGQRGDRGNGVPARKYQG